MKGSGPIVIGNALIWAAVILATSWILRETGHFASLIPILGGGAAGSIIVVGGGCRRLSKKK